MKEPTIVIPYSDWLKEYKEIESDVTTGESALDAQINDKLTAAQMGRVLIVDREVRGNEGLIPPNKLLLSQGASSAWANIHARMTREVKTPSGKSYQARATVAPVHESEDNETEDNEGLVWIDNEAALHSAWKYLKRRIPGYIRGRLLIILQHGDDVHAAIEMLHDQLDELEEELK